MVFTTHPQDVSKVTHFGDSNKQLEAMADRIRRVQDADADVQQTVVVHERTFAKALADELHAEIMRIASSPDQMVHRGRQGIYESEKAALQRFLSAETVADALAALESIPTRGPRP